eukprot:4480692-Pleurochrysis_carterae.AAC.1
MCSLPSSHKRQNERASNCWVPHFDNRAWRCATYVDLLFDLRLQVVELGRRNANVRKTLQLSLIHISEPTRRTPI